MIQTTPVQIQTYWKRKQRALRRQFLHGSASGKMKASRKFFRRRYQRTGNTPFTWRSLWGNKEEESLSANWALKLISSFSFCGSSWINLVTKHCGKHLCPPGSEKLKSFLRKKRHDRLFKDTAGSVLSSYVHTEHGIERLASLFKPTDNSSFLLMRKESDF